jgi:hypothetical protein
MAVRTTGEGRRTTGSGNPITWVVLALLLSLSGAGLVGQLSHPPGSAARAELTWAADSVIEDRLDAATVKLQAISEDVAALADDAKSAIAVLASGDAKTLQDILKHGQTTVRSIDVAVSTLRVSLDDLATTAPDAAFTYSNATLVRRGAVFAALDATRDLADRWTEVGTRGLSAADLSLTLQEHNQLVAQAADRGRAAAYGDALTLLEQATNQLDYARELRAELFPDTARTVLDDWLDLHAYHDDTLAKLYALLQASDGEVTGPIRTAYGNELQAREALPNDAEAIVVIIAELARQGLNQAVLAIDAARVQLDRAIGGVPAG